MEPMEPVSKYVVRPVRAEEWVAVREIRLAALRDPAAPIAFLEAYEAAVARSEEFWRERGYLKSAAPWSGGR